jgi:hypothetical protein
VDEMDGEDSLGIVLDDFVRRFDNESRWKDDLESKAFSMLGFIGVFIAVLFSLSSFSSNEIQDALTLLAAPMLLMVVAAILLFIVVFGYSTAVGPAIEDVFKARENMPHWLKTGLLVGYGTSILTNRILLSLRALFLQIAVLQVAASVLQLGLNLMTTALKWPDALSRTGIAAPLWQFVLFWLPALTLVSILLAKLISDYISLVTRQKEDLNQWKKLVNAQ